MPLQTSGTITLAQIQTEFGGSNPIGLNEYYRGGGRVPDTAANASIPTSGIIRLSNFYGGSAFTPVLSTRTSGSGTETVPTGATNVLIKVTGGGGSGGLGATTSGGAGGGGGGYAERTIAVTGGQTMSYAVGVGGASRPIGTAGNGTAGGTSTVSGTVAGGSVSMSGGGGATTTATGAIGGAGGTASGGTTNVNGTAGQDRDGTIDGAGGASQLAAGGAAGGGAGGVPGGGGGGDNRLENDSGAGGRGEVSFYYT